jgi:hypothetical protein
LKKKACVLTCQKKSMCITCPWIHVSNMSLNRLWRCRGPETATELCWCFAALLLLSCCFTDDAEAERQPPSSALLLLYCCLTAALLLLYWRCRGRETAIQLFYKMDFGTSTQHPRVTGGEKKKNA